MPGDGPLQQDGDQPEERPGDSRPGMHLEGTDGPRVPTDATEFPRLLEPGRQAGQRRRELSHVQPDSPIGFPFHDLFQVTRPVRVDHPNPGADDLGRPDLELRNLDPRQYAVTPEAWPSGDIKDLFGDPHGRDGERLFAGEGDWLQSGMLLTVRRYPPTRLVVDHLVSHACR